MRQERIENETQKAMNWSLWLIDNRDVPPHAAECVAVALSITVWGQPTTTRRFRGATICRTREDTETRISDRDSANAVATNCRSRTPSRNAVQSGDVRRTRLRRFAA